MRREGHLDESDGPDKSGVIAHFNQLENGRIELDLTIDDRTRTLPKL